MRIIVLLSLLFALFGCDDPAESAPSPVEPETPVALPEPAEPPASAPVAAEEPGDPAVQNDAAARATAAYAALRDAFRRGDVDAYLGAYTTPVACWYGQASVTSDAIGTSRGPQLEANAGSEHPMRIETVQLDVASATADEVELIDHGWTGEAGIDSNTVFHAKRIVMVRDGDAWHVQVEAPVTSDACGRGALTYEAPAVWTYLRDELAEFAEDCFVPEGGDPELYPGVGGSIGCMPSTNFESHGVWCEEHHGARSAEDCVAAVAAPMRAFYGSDTPEP